MSIGIYGTLHVAKEALFAQQSGVGVTSHNLANAHTQGYSRQRPVIETMSPQMIGGMYFGRGARLESITKSYDKFLNSNIALEKNMLGRWNAKETYLKRAESLFNESSEVGINKKMNRFWNAWEDLANHPEGIPERSILQNMGTDITSTFRSIAKELEDIRLDANNRIETVIKTVNRLSREIAELNEQILGTETQGANANDLTDQRTRRFEELSEIIDVRAIESGDGKITVMTGAGKPLVAENISFNLSVEADEARNNFYAIYFNQGSEQVDITDKITGGTLKGLLEIRDDTVAKYLNQLDLLASSFMTEVNRVHYTGYGLDGSTENYFFDTSLITLEADRDNKGDSRIYDSRIIDPTQLLSSDFELKFISSAPQESRYTVYDTLNENYLYRIDAGNSTLVFDDGSGDIAVSVAHGTFTGSDIARQIQEELNANASADQNYLVTYNQTTRRFNITNKGTADIDIKWEDSNIADILGFNKTNITITSNSSTASNSEAGTYIYSSQLYQIKSGANDRILFNDGGGNVTINLTAGIYSPDDLAAEIQAQLNAGAAPGQSYNVSFNNITRKFEITNNGAAAITLDWSNANSARTLGFTTSPMVIATGATADSDIARYTERIFDISKGVNDEIVFDDGGIGDGTGGTSVTSTLKAGKYTGEELAAEIERTLENTYGAAGQKYIVTFDSRAGTFTIINANKNKHAIDISFTGSTAASTLGFTADTNIAVNNSAASDAVNPVGTAATYDRIDFYGIAFKVADDTALPERGDILTVSTTKNAAINMAMDSVTATDPKKIAAAVRVFDIDGSNNTIVFNDTGDLAAGNHSKVIIPNGRYSPEELAKEIEQQLEAKGEGQSYNVHYDSDTNRFIFASNQGNANDLVLLWEAEETTADFVVGFDKKIFSIDATSNSFRFSEDGGLSFLNVNIPQGSYSGDELAQKIQEQMNLLGSNEYSVAYNAATREFTFTNNGDNNADLDMNSQIVTALGFTNAANPLASWASVSSDFNPGRLEAEDSVTGNYTTGIAQVGDNRNALDISHIKNMTVLLDETLTFDSFHSIIVSGVGNDVSTNSEILSNQQFMIEQYEQRRQAISGVSLDEEMINLIKYQQAFTASAKMVTTLDKMLDTIISMK